MRDWFTRATYTILGVFLFAAAAFVLYKAYKDHAPILDRIDERLPEVFRVNDFVFWGWVTAFLAAGATLTYLAIRRTRALRPKDDDGAAGIEVGEEGKGGTDYEPLREAWRQIEVRARQLAVDLSKAPVVVILSTDHAAAREVVRGSELPVDGVAPAADDGPIQAHFSEGRVFVSAAGASCFGLGNSSSSLGLMEAFCRGLNAWNPERPPLRGVLVVFPWEWLDRPAAEREAAGIRNDLWNLGRILRVQCPVYALVTRIEAHPGFAEYLRRTPASARARNRLGFSLPALSTTSEFIGEGLAWFSGVLQREMAWMFHKYATDAEGNARLYRLFHDFRFRRHELRRGLDAAFLAAKDIDAILLRGVYFAGTGEPPAFLASVVRGRVIPEMDSTTWNRFAIEEDKRHLKRGAAIAAAVTVPCLAVWGYVLFVLDSLGLWGYVFAGLIVAAWAAGLRWMAKSYPFPKPAAPPPTPEQLAALDADAEEEPAESSEETAALKAGR